MFETKLDKILRLVSNIDPEKYGRTRNFLNGDVTRLSPYISRGVISTKFVFEETLRRGFDPAKIQKFIQELAWRDYFQNVWRVKEELIDRDLRQTQPDVLNYKIPQAVVQADTGIDAIDDGIKTLYETGYVHNHVRMYTASIACNVGKSHWKIPAKWFYYNLLDADWASNALSWQWVAGAFSSKKYFANQENVNKFCGTSQLGTFLDREYAEFENIEIPESLRDLSIPELKTNLPARTAVNIKESLPTLIYNFYNLDPFWRADIEANRILLLEPKHFEKYPISQKSLNFALELARNIDGIQIFCGEFSRLSDELNSSEVYFKEHPTALHYKGNMDERDWMFPQARGYYSSFFKFWSKCQKFLPEAGL